MGLQRHKPSTNWWRISSIHSSTGKSTFCPLRRGQDIAQHDVPFLLQCFGAGSLPHDQGRVGLCRTGPRRRCSARSVAFDAILASAVGMFWIKASLSLVVAITWGVEPIFRPSPIPTFLGVVGSRTIDWGTIWGVWHARTGWPVCPHGGSMHPLQKHWIFEQNLWPILGRFKADRSSTMSMPCWGHGSRYLRWQWEHVFQIFLWCQAWHHLKHPVKSMGTGWSKLSSQPAILGSDLLFSCVVLFWGSDGLMQRLGADWLLHIDSDELFWPHCSQGQLWCNPKTL